MNKTQNVRVVVSDPSNKRSNESQVYSNRFNLDGTRIKLQLLDEIVKPEIGNFPHVSGADKPVKISGIFQVTDEDNAGKDIYDLMEAVGLSSIQQH